MRLNLKDIIHVPGASIPFEFELDYTGMEFNGETPVTEPVRVSGRVRNVADALLLEGEAVTTLSLVCDRCLKPFLEEKTVALDTLLAAEVENEDSDIVLLEGDEVDLDELVREAFILDMDTKHLCSENCKGLCPGCGVDLNHEECRCKPEVDPHLASLAKLLEDKD